MADLWEGIKKTLAGIAPVLGNAILPGVGGVAGSILASVLGVESGSAEDLSMALSKATPEQIQAIKEASYKHEEELLKIAAQKDIAYLQDVQNARLREVSVVQATGKKDINLYILAWVIMGGFMGLIAGLIAAELTGHPINGNPMLTLLLGSLSTDAGMVVGYFFGSSQSSQNKNELLANSVPAATVKK